jgi:hypothetical protein
LIASFVADSMASAGSSRRLVIACQVGVALGLALVVAGGLRKVFARPEAAWSQEQAAEFQAARNALHDLTYNEPGNHGSTRSPDEPSPERLAKRAEAKARFDRIEARLVEARSNYQHTGTWLVRLGLAAVITFGLGYLMLQEK